MLSEAAGGPPQVILIATGSEVAIALAAQEKLAAERHPHPRRVHAELGAFRRTES